MRTLFYLVLNETVFSIFPGKFFQLSILSIYSIQFQLEHKRSVESANRELERKAALFKHDLKEVRHLFFLYDHLQWTCCGLNISFFYQAQRRGEFETEAKRKVCRLKFYSYQFF